MRLRTTLISLLLACSALHATGAHKTFSVTDFSKGVDTYHAPASLPDGFVQDSQNVLFDDVAPVAKRTGFTVAWSTKAYSFTALSTYTDQTNTSWQIARSSDQLTASNLAGTIVKISTVSSNDTVGTTTAFGAAYFVDQSQGVYFWNGTSTTWVSGSPRGSIVTQFHNRLWVTGAAVPNGNQLYGSAYYNGLSWSTGLNATDPVQYSIGLQDNFDNVTAAYVYLDTLYLFKHYSIFALYGFDQSNFQLSQLTQECGCIDGNSIQTFNGGLKFVSLRGVETFDGYHCTRISDPIKNKVDPAIQAGGFSQQSWVLQSQADWNSGTFNPSGNLSTTIAAPALVLSTGTATNSTSAAFNLGTLSNVQVANNQVSIGTNNSGTITDPSFEGTLSNNYTSTGFSFVNAYAPSTCGTTNPQSGSQFLSYGTGSAVVAGLRAEFDDFNSGSVLASTILTCPGSCSTSWTQSTLSSSGLIGKRAYVKFCSTNDLPGASCTGNNTKTKSSYLIGGDLTFYYNCSGDASQNFIGVDNVAGGSSTITTGTFISQVFDTTASSSSVTVSISSTSNTEAVTFGLQHSTAAVGGFRDLTTLQNTSLTSNRYLRYISTFSLGSGDYAFSTLNSATLQWTASSGTFKSPSHSMSGISSFGNFSVNDTVSGGNIAFTMCTSSAATMVTSTCAVQAANAQITVASNTFVQWSATFTVTAATQTPTLNSGTVQWFSGSKAPPMASTVWDNRYWLSLTTTTADSANDAVLVLNARGAWATFDIHAGGFTQYKGSLYHADSSGTGGVYLDNQGYADNGRAINAYVRTKDLSLGGLSYDDYLYSVYPEATNTGACTMTIQYDMDHAGVNMSLGSPLLSEYSNIAAVRLPFPVDSSHQDFGQSINFTVGTNDAICAWNFYGLDGLYKSRPLQ